ncbi:MAG TPA: hypothetical protein VG106_08480 [Vicinamibacterales bacterium]|nr:hypothetical protein [Vicinamibacterales bacterium]
MVALGLHLYHGVWSSLRTLGASKSSPNPLRRPAVVALAVTVWLGFTIIPLAVFAGLVRPRPAGETSPGATAVVTRHVPAE